MKKGMTRETRILAEKEFVYDFWRHTKRRYDSYLEHMEHTLEDNDEWKIVAGCSVEFFALLTASYAQTFLSDTEGKTKKEMMLELLGSLYDDLAKSKSEFTSKKTDLSDMVNNIINLANHKGTVN